MNAHYTVHMRSRPGMFEQYAGAVEVVASDPEDAVDKAFAKLKRGAFPERSRDMWIVEKVETNGRRS